MMIGLLTAVWALPSQAQELKKVMLFTQTGKIAEARAEIDKAIADPKSDEYTIIGIGYRARDRS